MVGITVRYVDECAREFARMKMETRHKVYGRRGEDDRDVEFDLDPQDVEWWCEVFTAIAETKYVTLFATRRDPTEQAATRAENMVLRDELEQRGVDVDKLLNDHPIE